MSKYIDADKLTAEIERRKEKNERRLDNIIPIRRKDTMDEEQLVKIELRDKVDKAYLNGVLITLSDVLSFISFFQQEKPEMDLEKFTEKMDDWKARYNHPDNIPIKATMAFTARMFYQYPNVARLWYEQLPKATMD